MSTPPHLSKAKSLVLAKRILAYFWPYKWFVLLSFFCLALVAACRGSLYALQFRQE